MSRRLALAVVAIAAVALYLPSLRNGFAYDDVPIIQLNERVHSVRHAPEIFANRYWQNPELGLYRPLTSFSYAVDWTVSGGSTVWFHAVNVLWNAAACVLLFLLLSAFAPVGAALAGALLFAVHPLHVEAIANVVGRAELMAATFSFGALYVWVRGTRDSYASKRTIVAVAALFALGLLSKESAIMLPALIVLIDAARGALTRANAASWLRRNGLALGTLLAVAAALLAIRTLVLGAVAPASLSAALEVVGPVARRLTALQIWPIIVRLLFVPTVLLADYAPHVIMPATTLTAKVALGAIVPIGLVTGGIIAWWRGRGKLALVLLWLPIAMLPVANLVLPIGVLVAERALYLPSAALAFAIAFTGAYASKSRYARPAWLGAAAVCLLLAARSRQRIPDWQSTDSIMAALLRDRPDSYAAHWHAARVAARRREPHLALERYGQALELWPYRRRLVVEAASYAAQSREYAYARKLSAYLFEQWPGDLDGGRLLAGAALDMGDTAAARAAIARALASHPGDSLLLRMRAALSRDTMP